MKNKSKKWKWFLLIIPALMILGIITTTLDEMKSKDGIYYLTVKNQSTKTASLDKTSWIKIEGEQITIKEGGKEYTYSFNTENDQAADLTHEKGIYPAFHMNKRYWITVPLDDTFTDEKVLELFEISWDLTRKKK